MGAVLALGMASVSVSVTSKAAAVEQPPVTLPKAHIKRDQPLLSETDARAKDREQLRRYFLQERPDGLR